MRRRIGILLMALCLAGCGHRSGRAVQDALLRELLAKIDSADVFQARKEAQLSALKEEALALDVRDTAYFYACMDLAANYANYISDSALVWIGRARDAARDLGREDLYYRSELNKAAALTRTGYFIEAKLILDAIPVKKLPESIQSLYYRRQTDLHHAFYSGLSPGSEFREEFIRRYNAYRDTFIMIAPLQEPTLRELEKKAGREGRFEDALAINDKRLAMVRDSLSQENALVLFDRHAIYRYYMQRPVSDHVEYLLESAIADVYCANRNIASLRFVEAYLISKGDVASAKIVSDYYFKAMTLFGSRTRLLDALEISMNISDEYAGILRREKRLSQTALLLLVILFCVLLVVLWQMVLSRRRIGRLNKELERSGKAATGYVLGFFNLYSSYISRLQGLRSKINVNLRRGNTDYILSLTDPSKDITGDELKEMYANFDKAFLDIFPNYVADFNALLKPECQIVPRKDERLTMELRIFAVIKLGITDSARISELLHCSIKTVYNKRSEINGKLAIDREKFPEALNRI